MILEYDPGELPVGPPANHELSHEKRFRELRDAGFEQVERFDMHRFHDFEVWRPTGGGFQTAMRRWGIACIVALLGAFVGAGAQTSEGAAAGLREWISLRFPGTEWVDTAGLAEWTSDVSTELVLLDARTAEEFDVSRLRGAARVDPDAEALDIGAVSRSTRIVVYCSVGYRSAAVARRLTRDGYEKVFNLEGGIFQWANEGRPVFRGDERVEKVHPYDRVWGRYLHAELHSER